MGVKIGDLIHVPSDAMLTKMSGSDHRTACYITTRPKSLLVAEMKSGMVGVLFRGDLWYVQKKDVFILGGKNE
tara:strand:- start:395 stop:613 length:219 start_codon:yes stop_codon:yes gene_type:complete